METVRYKTLVDALGKERADELTSGIEPEGKGVGTVSQEEYGKIREHQETDSRIEGELGDMGFTGFKPSPPPETTPEEKDADEDPETER